MHPESIEKNTAFILRNIGNNKAFSDFYLAGGTALALLFFLLKKYSLEELIEFFEQKYKGIEYNKLHILKSLTYFDDAETEPMPIMLKQTSWPSVKKTLQIKATEFLKTAN